MFDTTNLHPMIVHFPIALLIFGFLADLTGLFIRKDFFHKMAFYLLIGGTIGVVAAYISGGAAEEMVNEAGALEKVLDAHENSALLTVWIMTITALVRISSVFIRKYNITVRNISLIIFAVGIISVARTGHYGGQLVYKHAAGVQLILDYPVNDNLQNDNSGKSSKDFQKEDNAIKEEDEN